MPLLLLDHASRPFTDSQRSPTPLDAPPPPPAATALSALPPRKHDTLIYQTLGTFKNSELEETLNQQCRIVFITSDTADRDSWLS